jgi:SsrA-binding protein
MSKKAKKSENAAQKYSPIISNKKARFNYHLLEKLEAGIALLGTEVKSLRQGKANLEEAFCRVRDGELYLLGCNIAPYTHGNMVNHDPLRPRKLLVHRRELLKIESKINQKGLTLIPVRIYFARGLAKVEIALAHGKSQKDKRDKIKEQEAKREVRRAMQGKW